MRITSKGQVAIPQEIRDLRGLLPHTKVELELAGDHARIRKARRTPGESVRGRLAVEVLHGTADTRLSA
jgi:AbrB family looped-hinge helix DNA binding protein